MVGAGVRQPSVFAKLLRGDRGWGGHQFPTGLIGTKQLLAFYVDSIARALAQDMDTGGDVGAACKRALVDIARRMADGRHDWVERANAAIVVKAAFVGFQSDKRDWLSALLSNGVLREDPHPDGSDNDDPLNERDDVIRFAFQRFQDHLMADALLTIVSDIRAAFAPDGAFSFLYSKHGGLLWEWNGLIEALSIQVPEKFDLEFVDVLPGGEERHWQANTIENAFLQSVRWREPNKITDRTLTLANRLNSGPSGIVSLLIELAPRKDHPWNAIFLDNRLYRWKAWERDRNWTMTISQDGVYDEHPVNRLLDWCANAPKESADKETLHLCALTLCWLFCSTAPSVRDRATKALSSLLTDCPDLFPELMAHFVDADDLYLIERLLAAGYGTLIRHPDLGHATRFASSVIQHTFRKKGIPPNLLLRDYAAGIVSCSRGPGSN